jgi:serine/threonine-protein kinase OSR1/STK39
LPGVSDAYSYPAQADGYDVYAEIGSGAFSTVYRGVVRESGEEVAIKVIDLDLFNTNWDEIRREILIMSQLQHPNVVRLKTAFVDGQDLWIVMHFAEAGSAAAIMKELQPHDSGAQGIKDEVVIATILKEVLQALAYFHKHGSIHRDVKAGNILLTATGDVLLADFGVAGTLMEGGDRKKNRQTFTGTPCWMAPGSPTRALRQTRK